MSQKKRAVSGAGATRSPAPQQSSPSAEALAVLRERFGFEEFNRGQWPPISAVLDGRDALVVMPTGSGKSLVYQFPALVLDGLTLVVSPLIALMKDQQDKLVAQGVDAIAVIGAATAAGTPEEAPPVLCVPAPVEAVLTPLRGETAGAFFFALAAF